MASAGNTQSIKRIIDYTNSTGTPGDVLSTTVNGLEWVAGGGGGGTLQQVCTAGNTTNTSIIMTGKIDIETDGATNPISIGNVAGLTNQGTFAIAIGSESGYINQGAQAIAIGYQSGATNQGVHAVAIGTNAGGTNQAAESVAIGNLAGSTGQSQKSVAIGYKAGMLTQADFAVAIGCQAGATAQSINAIAIGEEAGEGYQADGAIAIGKLSGSSTQGTRAVAIGDAAGSHTQGDYAVAIGAAAGATNQGQYAVAIGSNAGYTGQRANAIAIGNQAGYQDQYQNSIILNASGSQLNNSTVSGFFVKPVRIDAVTSNLISYNNATSEIIQSNVYISNDRITAREFITDGNNVGTLASPIAINFNGSPLYTLPILTYQYKSTLICYNSTGSTGSFSVLVTTPYTDVLSNYTVKVYYSYLWIINPSSLFNTTYLVSQGTASTQFEVTLLFSSFTSSTFPNGNTQPIMLTVELEQRI